PPPPQVVIRSVSYGGSGCPDGSASVSISSDRTTLNLIFDSFQAYIGPAVSITQNRHNCQMNIDLDVPTGWTWSVWSVDQRGYLQLDPGVSATLAATYYFSGQTKQSRLARTFTGPYAGDYLKRDQADVAIWSPCSGSGMFNVNQAVGLTTSKCLGGGAGDG
ncbi:hypothetical protein EJ06DRAFT_577531, partial [Trichodelitschia bisporula]